MVTVPCCLMSVDEVPTETGTLPVGVTQVSGVGEPPFCDFLLLVNLSCRRVDHHLCCSGRESFTAVPGCFGSPEPRIRGSVDYERACVLSLLTVKGIKKASLSERNG